MTKINETTVIELRKSWSQPQVMKLDAGSAEAMGTGIDDGGLPGNARS